jgi:glycosyltransferase involved in cell wall biosynthesis
MNLKLTLGYSTLAERVATLVEPPVNPNWETVLVVQNPNQFDWQGTRFTELSARNDFRHHELVSKGVAKSRNKALDLAKGEYLIFSDDDITFSATGLQQAIDYLDSHPEVSLLLGQATDESGTLRKRYPKAIEKLGSLNSARAATYEMIIRVSEVRRLGVRFDEDFGAGAKNYLGDEYIFVVDLIKAGGKAVFAPITLAQHPTESSGSRWGSEQDRRARAIIFTRVFGALAPFVRLPFGLRRRRELGSLKNVLLFVLGR